MRSRLPRAGAARSECPESTVPWISISEVWWAMSNTVIHFGSVGLHKWLAFYCLRGASVREQVLSKKKKATKRSFSSCNWGTCRWRIRLSLCQFFKVGKRTEASEGERPCIELDPSFTLDMCAVQATLVDVIANIPNVYSSMTSARARRTLQASCLRWPCQALFSHRRSGSLESGMAREFPSNMSFLQSLGHRILSEKLGVSIKMIPWLVDWKPEKSKPHILGKKSVGRGSGGLKFLESISYLKGLFFYPSGARGAGFSSKFLCLVFILGESLNFLAKESFIIARKGR